LSLNDKDVSLGDNKGVGLHPDIANSTVSLAANFVRLRSSHWSNLNAVADHRPHDRRAGDHFTRDKEAARNFSKTAGVIDPLKENSSESMTAGRTRTPGYAVDTAARYASSSANVAYGAARMAYGHVSGDEAVWGKW
ncbi:hypothetical protein BKA93DRAFT_726564, partial [Sparassis latifolia]